MRRLCLPMAYHLGSIDYSSTLHRVDLLNYEWHFALTICTANTKATSWRDAFNSLLRCPSQSQLTDYAGQSLLYWSYNSDSRFLIVAKTIVHEPSEVISPEISKAFQSKTSFCLDGISFRVAWGCFKQNCEFSFLNKKVSLPLELRNDIIRSSWFGCLLQLAILQRFNNRGRKTATIVQKVLLHISSFNWLTWNGASNHRKQIRSQQGHSRSQWESKSISQSSHPIQNVRP